MGTPTVLELRELYEKSFCRIMRSARVRRRGQEDAFHALLVDIKEQHASAQQNVALGLQEVLRDQERDYDFSHFLDNFYMSRISLRMLIGQYNALHGERDGMVGIIQKECSPARIARQAAEDATG